MSKKGNLNIIDEDGKIIGEDSRENIHNKGLLHREVHVWFYTPKGEIIFQHRRHFSRFIGRNCGRPC